MTSVQWVYSLFFQICKIYRLCHSNSYSFNCDFCNANHLCCSIFTSKVIQIGKILNVHMDSLQWIDQNSGTMRFSSTVTDKKDKTMDTPKTVNTFNSTFRLSCRRHQSSSIPDDDCKIVETSN